MKIIVTHAYSKDNKGDAVLLSVIIADMRRVFADPSITVLTMDKCPPGETFEGAPIKASFMQTAFGRPGGIVSRSLYCVFMVAATTLWAGIYRLSGKNMPLPRELKEIAALYRDSDLIAHVGGGYFRGVPGPRSTALLALLLHPLLLGDLLAKPMVVYPQSVGPFGNKAQAAMAAFALKRAAVLMVRENISMELLARMGVRKNVVRSIDGGFAFSAGKKTETIKDLYLPEGRPLVGVTVRRWLKPQGQKNYEKNMAEFADRIIERYGAGIVFIPQVTASQHNDDDRVVAEKIYRLMRNKKNARALTQRLDHYQIKTIYEVMDLAVGTRFHSVIFSLTGFVPAIAIEYEHKTSGIMRDLGLEKWVVPIEKVKAADLCRLFDELAAHKEDYQKHLRQVLPAYIEQSRNAAVIAERAFDRAVAARTRKK